MALALNNLQRLNCHKQRNQTSTLLQYLGSNVSSESDVNICIGRVWPAIDRLSVIWKSDFSDKIKWDFFQAVAVTVLLYGCTAWTLISHLEKKLDESNAKMLHYVLKKSWKQYSTKQQLYGHLVPILQAIHVRLTRHC